MIEVRASDLRPGDRVRARPGHSRVVRRARPTMLGVIKVTWEDGWDDYFDKEEPMSVIERDPAAVRDVR